MEDGPIWFLYFFDSLKPGWNHRLHHLQPFRYPDIIALCTDDVPTSMNFFLGYHQAMTSKVARNLCLQWKIICIPTQNTLTTSRKSALGFHSLHFTWVIFQFEEQKMRRTSNFKSCFAYSPQGAFGAPPVLDTTAAPPQASRVSEWTFRDLNGSCGNRFHEEMKEHERYLFNVLIERWNKKWSLETVAMSTCQGCVFLLGGVTSIESQLQVLCLTNIIRIIIFRILCKIVPTHAQKNRQEKEYGSSLTKHQPVIEQLNCWAVTVP